MNNTFFFINNRCSFFPYFGNNNGKGCVCQIWRHGRLHSLGWEWKLWCFRFPWRFALRLLRTALLFAARRLLFRRWLLIRRWFLIRRRLLLRGFLLFSWLLLLLLLRLLIRWLLLRGFLRRRSGWFFVVILWRAVFWRAGWAVEESVEELLHPCCWFKAFLSSSSQKYNKFRLQSTIQEKKKKKKRTAAELVVKQRERENFSIKKPSVFQFKNHIKNK